MACEVTWRFSLTRKPYKEFFKKIKSNQRIKSTLTEKSRELHVKFTRIVFMPIPPLRFIHFQVIFQMTPLSLLNDSFSFFPHMIHLFSWIFSAWFICHFLNMTRFLPVHPFLHVICHLITFSHVIFWVDSFLFQTIHFSSVISAADSFVFKWEFDSFFLWSHEMHVIFRSLCSWFGNGELQYRIPTDHTEFESNTSLGRRTAPVLVLSDRIWAHKRFPLDRKTIRTPTTYLEELMESEWVRCGIWKGMLTTANMWSTNKKHSALACL